MCVDKLKLDVKKIKCMIVRGVRREQKVDVILKCSDGTLIERVRRINYLGIIVDDTSRLGDHCDYMLKKMGKKISFLNGIGNSVSVYIRCVMYKSIMAPRFEYFAILITNMDETQVRCKERRIGL